MSESDRRLSAPGREAEATARLPGVDERLAPPETRLEYLHGIEIFAAPADQPHAIQHGDLAYVLRAHVAKGYLSAVDMLTRTSEVSDFAPDASVFVDDVDPKTGRRYLEELAFEICDKQSIGVPTSKARELARRGVRRVFCVVVAHRRVLEWSRDTDGWETLVLDSSIDDRCFALPLPVAAILDAAAADEAVVKALLSRGVPALEAELERQRAEGRREGRNVGHNEGRTEGRAEGRTEGRADSILTILDARAIVVDAASRTRILGERNVEVLDSWLRRALNASSVSDLLAGV